MKMRRVDLINSDTMKYASLQLWPNNTVYVQPDGLEELKFASGNFTAPFEMIARSLHHSLLLNT